MATHAITVLSEDFPPNVGGVAQWARGVANGLHAAGNRVNVVCRHCGDYGAAGEHAYPVRYLKHDHWKKMRTWYWRSAFAEQLGRGDVPDVVIGSKWNTTRGVVKLARRRNIPLVTVVHGTDVTRPMPWLKRRWLKSTLAGSAKIVSVSRFTADWLVEHLGMPSASIAVVPNGVEPEAFAACADFADLKARLELGDEKIVLTLSRIIERKGHDMVIRALPAIRESVPGTRYLIAGPGHDDEIERLKTIAREHGVFDAVTFLGYVARDDLARLYGLCDVYAMPSRFDTRTGDSEGFGITYLEANACRKPVIGGRSGGVADAIVDGETGFLVDPHSPAEIAERATAVLRDPARAAAMGEVGYRRVVDEYNWRAISQRILELL
ncbi:MAG: glycosyltransferase family 4 protein [Planctomycetota bacterium]|nr:glycosyltransferase family 4 protein [Planctomycetota bacterium]